MGVRSRSLPCLAALLGVGLACWTAAASALQAEAPPEHPPVRPAPGGTRGPFEVAFSPDGGRLYATEFDEGTLVEIERASGKILRRISTGGREPTGLAISPDGRWALATNSFSGSLAIVDLQAGETEQLLLPGMPWDVVISPDGARAYVSVSQLDRIAVIDLPARSVAATLSTGRRPRALSLTPDGRVLVTANFTEGSLTFVDTTVPRIIGHGPTTAVNLRGVAVFPEGRVAYCVGQRAQNERPTETAIGIWSNQAFVQAPNGPRNTLENIWLDFIGTDVADPDSVILDPRRRRTYITCSGGHSLNVLPLRGGGEPQVVRGVGAMPRGVALSPDGKEIWIACELSNELVAVDADTLKIARRVPLGPPSGRDPHLLGRFLFTTATITRGQQFSCNSCHPDGNTDGISWKFVHVDDAFGRETDRNVRVLRGDLAATAPFRWTGHDRDLRAFVQTEVTRLLQGRELTDAELDGMVGFLRNRPLPPNPHRAPGGSFTEQALRGRALFEGKAGCAVCHGGPRAGGGTMAWIGTTKEGIDLETPHLEGVYDSDPYLHDGRARTLEEIFTRHNPAQRHGRAHELTPEELADLIAYVRQL